MTRSIALPFAALALLASTPALAREAQPQHNEVAIDVGVTVANNSNGAQVGVQYTWTPGALQRWDDVPAVLRRFVRHPSALWVRGHRDGNSLDARTAGLAGGRLDLLGGLLYVAGEAGIEYAEANYNDRHEKAYATVPVAFELGARPLPLLSLGATYRRRQGVWGAPADGFYPTQRSGHDQDIGVVLTWALPSWRLFGTLSAGWLTQDWTFERFHPGPIEVDGVRGEAMLSLQASPRVSYQLRVAGSQEDWDNRRLGDSGDGSEEWVGEAVRRTINGVDGDLSMVYWHRGTYGFRVGLGGGFREAEPIYYPTECRDCNLDRGFGRLLFGVVGRY